MTRTISKGAFGAGLFLSLCGGWQVVLAASPAGALPHRSWQFQSADWNYLQKAIPLARSAGMNRIQLSHNIVMDAEELWEGKGSAAKLELVRKAAALAHKRDLKVDIWTHELSGLPKDRFRDPSGKKVVLSPELWKWVEEKYERLFKLVPDIDGLVLTFAETDYSVYSDSVVSGEAPPQRVARLIKVMADICSRRDKLLVVRTFVYEPREIEFMHEALQAVAQQVGANVVVMTKCVPHDWTPYYPFDPLLGNVSGLRQVVEIDLGEEFTGQSRLLHCEVDYVKCVMDYARDRDVIGAVARVERLENHALGTPNEVNLHAFSRLTQDGGLSADELWREWSVKRYGARPAPHVVRALRRTYEITNLTYFPLEYWIADHSQVPTWAYAVGHISSRQNAKWIPSPKQILARDELLAPTGDTLVKIDNEKDLAKKMLEMSRKDLGLGYTEGLANAEYDRLRRYFDLAEENIEVFRYHNLSLFSALRYRAGAVRGDVPPEDPETVLQQTLLYVAKLRQQADRIESRFGPNVWPGTPSRVRQFADEVEAQVRMRRVTTGGR